MAGRARCGPPSAARQWCKRPTAARRHAISPHISPYLPMSPRGLLLHAGTPHSPEPQADRGRVRVRGRCVHRETAPLPAVSRVARSDPPPAALVLARALRRLARPARPGAVQGVGPRARARVGLPARRARGVQVHERRLGARWPPARRTESPVAGLLAPRWACRLRLGARSRPPTRGHAPRSSMVKASEVERPSVWASGYTYSYRGQPSGSGLVLVRVAVF